MAFEDAQDYGTFSAAVDAVVRRSGREPLRSEIASQVRQIYRSNQVDASFSQDRVEIEFTADRNPYRWQIPANFRAIEKARVINRYGPRGEFLYYKKSPPGSLMISRQIAGGVDRVYYRGGDIVVFAGHTVNDMVGVSYFTYLPPLRDYGPDVTQRPWRYDLDRGEWIDQRASFPMLANGDPDPRSAAPFEGSTNWMLFHWFELVVRGALTTILNAVDDPRGPKVFAEYARLQSALKRGELE